MAYWMRWRCSSNARDGNVRSRRSERRLEHQQARPNVHDRLMCCINLSHPSEAPTEENMLGPASSTKFRCMFDEASTNVDDDM